MTSTPAASSVQSEYNIVKFTGSGASADGNADQRAVETALLVRVRDHADDKAFGALFTLFTPKLKSWFCGQGHDPAQAETVVQDVMIATWTRARSFDPDKASARTWIYTLARNRMIDLHRAGTRRQRSYDEFAAVVALDEPVADAAQQGADRARVDAALATLPDDQREIIVMAYMEGRSQRDIAVTLDLPIGTVKSRTRLAFCKLRRLMEERP